MVPQEQNPQIRADPEEILGEYEHQGHSHPGAEKHQPAQTPHRILPETKGIVYDMRAGPFLCLLVPGSGLAGGGHFLRRLHGLQMCIRDRSLPSVMV